MEGEAPKRCEHCRIRRARRRYCTRCGAMASALYKRELRRKAKEEGRLYWFEWWEKTFGPDAAAKRREYRTKYMRNYRRRKRGARAA